MDFNPGWIATGCTVLGTIIGWIVILVKQAKNEAKHMGALEEKIKTLSGEVVNLRDEVTEMIGKVGRVEGALNGLFRSRH